MPKPTALNDLSFSILLKWLDQNHEAAGQKYESIRMRLIKIFYARGCHNAEELADLTIDRVADQAESLVEKYEGNPANFFYGVAKKIFLENKRQPKLENLNHTLNQDPGNSDELELNDKCLRRCLDQFKADQKEMILSYYRFEKQKKITHRKRMAEKLGISTANLRLRVYRLRGDLEKCVLKCISEN